ncbi:MAG: 3-hydroxyacyl-CoA dehydrogenase family protein [Lentisphaerae bacterium]|jgi:3-hydroxybutyryl-CoA dehydrogenase|nr:3-hydroxyacyl-CoA dehydrogenase family protein [Lentisphaerota bacterium]MBT4823109.1 3-hydroxyacyl-CoA dehydrogenase family protein [Lentisphaerota bacterium]MBT5605503.1 3-hydroxyacyl-CoA dehydrogenase family protein [Lentisphaerota bacterium]MBT7060066.1 3-hydroxyacyl-CoA dehydrogenase family protein [Lentisphaerota bacterium]MBT7840874.1 3-hydroxyacyl-CoA dehydrogenase family protein [Lentisphaerota bacterium]
MGEQSKAAGVGTVGLVGLGLMGRGIAACLLSHGMRVVAFNRTAERARKAREFIANAMDEVVARGVAEAETVADWAERFTIVPAIDGLAECPFVVESVKEDIVLKRDLFGQLEACLAADAVIASNTSSFPLTMLQSKSQHPERFVIMHWSEPAWITRFLEIVRNEVTSEATITRTKALGLACGKEPSFLNFDIRGFVANRLMYAFIREACHLADIGVADVATIDRSFRNDVGWWATIAGPFRWMDLTGIQAYGLVMEGLLPELCNDGKLPEIMEKMMAEGAEGTGNQTGFYPYTPETAKVWEEAWVEFSYDVRELLQKHEARLRERGALE